MSDYPIDSVPDQPLDYQQAKRLLYQLSRARRRHADELRKAVEAAARADAEYRKTISVETIKAKAEHPATVATKIAEGSDAAYQARIKRGVADGTVAALQSRDRLFDDDNANARALIRWSERYAPEGSWEPT